ncbi:MAG: Tat pathway signal sequence [Chthoniobacteraceae bacterium]
MSEAYHFYWGDLHNHCNLTYGHGDPVAAFEAAREHLDFATVTPHADWPDIPAFDDPGMAWVIGYHKEAFGRIREHWGDYLALVRRFDEAGKFVAFVSYETHNMKSGDHVVLYRDLEASLVCGDSISALRERLLGQAAVVTPHHIGYIPGFRGLNWDDFREGALTPFVEMVSRHGAAETGEGDFPYLHDMGPRTEAGCVAEGLRRGYKFGLMGSTDQHAGYPGSYGDGRVCVLAPELSREAIWEALKARRMYAATGDKILVDFTLNGALIGSEIEAGRRELRFRVEGEDLIDFIEVIKNGRTLARVNGDFGFDVPQAEVVRAKIRVEVGWSRRREPVRWDVELGLTGGRILAATPCFRGAPYTSPREDGGETFKTLVNRVLERSERTVRAELYTVKNPNTVTPTTQAIILDVEMPQSASLLCKLNGWSRRATLASLLEGGQAHFLDGWLSEAVQIHRAIPESAFVLDASFSDERGGDGTDYYYLRVRQRNHQWAWTTPVWVH